MNELIERVAEKIWEAAETADVGDWEITKRQAGENDWDVRETYAQARAAIAAMREPTEAMIRAGVDAAVSDILDIVAHSTVETTFTAMIDEVLRE